eukprot:364188-Chlamydomonas_euryale.AAC.7
MCTTAAKLYSIITDMHKSEINHPSLDDDEVLIDNGIVEDDDGDFFPPEESITYMRKCTARATLRSSLQSASMRQIEASERGRLVRSGLGLVKSGHRSMHVCMHACMHARDA